MENDFDRWNKKKKEIDSLNKMKFCHEREIWWSYIGRNVGHEQNGEPLDFLRPVLILRKMSKNTSIVLPLTSSEGVHSFRIPIGIINDKTTSVIISQIKVLDHKRLLNRISTLKKQKFLEIRKSVKDLF